MAYLYSFDQKIKLKICKIIIIDSIKTKNLHKHEPAFIDKFINFGSFIMVTYIYGLIETFLENFLICSKN